MKLTFESRLAVFVLIRILLCTATICLFVFGVCPFIAELTIRTVIIITFGSVMCLFTAATIARHVKDLIAIPLNKVLESAQLLSQASTAMTSVTKGLSKNADIMVEFTGLLDKMADVCGDEKDQENNVTTVQITISSESDDTDK